MRLEEIASKVKCSIPEVFSASKFTSEFEELASRVNSEELGSDGLTAAGTASNGSVPAILSSADISVFKVVILICVMVLPRRSIY